MKKDRSYGSKYHRDQLRIAWEAVRRSPEYQEDFENYDNACAEAQVGELSHLKDLPQEIRTKLHRFRDKWGCDPFPPGFTLKEIEEKLGQLYRQAKKGIISSKVQEGLKHERQWRGLKGKEKFSKGPNIRMEFGGMYNRLKGFKRGIDTVVRCREREEELALLRKLCELNVSDTLPPPKEWVPRLSKGGWSPPSRIHLSINLDAASEGEILQRVKNEVGYYQRLRKRLGLSRSRPRYHLDIYADYFKVYDMFQDDKNAEEIAESIWPKEYESSGGRDDMGGKSALSQRVYDYRDRVIEIIDEMVGTVREGGIKI